MTKTQWPLFVIVICLLLAQSAPLFIWCFANMRTYGTIGETENGGIVLFSRLGIEMWGAPGLFDYQNVE